MYRQIGVIFLSSILLAFAYNQFLLPHKILSGGITGIAMIIGLLTPLNPGITIFLLNVPLFVLGLLKLGKRFILYSIFSVFVTSLAMQYIPMKPVTPEPILASVFGGVISGIAAGLILRSSGSSGGFDIIGLLITRYRDYPLGALLFALNAVIVFISGFLFNWTLALYTMVTIYVSGWVVDSIHTRHIKLTVMIISSRGEKIKEQLLSHLHRGITVLDGEGAYTQEKKKILITVITRYELQEVKRLIREADPHAFVNITETVAVMGSFRRD